MADKEKESEVIVKNVDITQDVKSFKLQWNILPFISVHMFDCSPNTPCKLQVRTNTLVNTADPRNTDIGENKKGTEEPLNEKEDSVHKEHEAREEAENKMSLVSEKRKKHRC